MVTELGFVTDNVTDISPVRALAVNVWLRGPGKGKLSDCRRSRDALMHLIAATRRVRPVAAARNAADVSELQRHARCPTCRRSKECL